MNNISPIVICPGFHEQKLTHSFVENITNYCPDLDNLLIFPTDQYPPYSGFHLKHYLQKKCKQKSQNLMFIAFSAAVTAATTPALKAINIKFCDFCLHFFCK